MKYYRPAINEDFKELDITYFNYMSMSDEIKLLISQGLLHKAEKKMQDTSGMGLNDCKRYSRMYHSYVKAKRDFTIGKSVYVEY